MAMITCPECKKKIGENADSCPNCGYQLTPEKIAEIKKKEQRALKGCGIGCLSVISVIIIFFIYLTSSSSLDSGNKSLKVTVQAGQLSMLAEYPEGRNVFVYKKDGTIDNRPNDLEELCRDYLFYRSKVLKYGRAGMTDKAARYRLSFQEELWLLLQITLLKTGRESSITTAPSRQPSLTGFYIMRKPWLLRAKVTA